MATLYVVNCTGQNRVVNYRLDYATDDKGNIVRKGMVPYKSIMVPARTQMPFGGDLYPQQVQDIVGQLEETCGAVHVDVVKTAKAEGVVKMIWSLDKAVPRAILEDVVSHNIGRLTDQGATRRQRLALAANANLNQVVDSPLPTFEVEFEASEEDHDMVSPDLREGLQINNTLNAPARRAGRKR